MSAFDDALKMVLKYEGGFVNDPNDHGGATNKGITQVNYDSYRVSKKLTKQSVEKITDEEVSDIYFKNYWSAAKCDQLPIQVAYVVFDTAVNSGVGRSVKFLQRTVGAVDDGAIGPQTLELVKSFCNIKGALNIANTFINMREGFLKGIVDRDPTQKKFLKGWLNRTSSLRTIIGKL